jgi:hypothetical protein
MRLRVRQISLIGTSRTVKFEPGLNVILSSTTTGKTSLMRLLRVLLGSDYDGIIPELRPVPDVSGRLEIGEERVAVVRRLVQSDNAAVDVATDEVALRLEAMRSERPDQFSYGDWLIEQLGLPHLRVPTAPSRPAESATTPVSISDYLRFCRITQKQIDVDVLGSSNFFTDYKRRIAFRIYFGSYDAKVAELQEELRGIEGELRVVNSGSSAFDEFLEGTALSNRASIEAELEQARLRLAEAEGTRRILPQEARDTPAAAKGAAHVRDLDRALADLQGRLEAEALGAEQMADLGKQLRAQSQRLTKAVVAGSHLVDFDFLICPRCGHGVDAGRTGEGSCYLCLQVPAEEPSREDLIVEQTRIDAQIREAEELEGRHIEARAEIDRRAEQAQAERLVAAARLEELSESFISDRADEIATLAADRAQAEATIERCEELLGMLEKADRARAQAEQLRARRTVLEHELTRAERSDDAAQRRIDHLEGRFAELVEALELPEFETDNEPRAAINQANYEPIVNGRPIDRHSGGMALMINVAYMLAIHRTNLDLDLKIPRLLMIDGITKNLGRDEYDSRRYRLIWEQLAELHHNHAEDLQLIVAANDIPDFIEDLDVTCLRLSEEDRLVPPAIEGDEAEGDEVDD